ncbi:DUF6053 domain-containing protein [Lysobacter enzymogenes]
MGGPSGPRLCAQVAAN